MSFRYNARRAPQRGPARWREQDRRVARPCQASNPLFSGEENVHIFIDAVAALLQPYELTDQQRFIVLKSRLTGVVAQWCELILQPEMNQDNSMYDQLVAGLKYTYGWKYPEPSPLRSASPVGISHKIEIQDVHERTCRVADADNRLTERLNAEKERHRQELLRKVDDERQRLENQRKEETERKRLQAEQQAESDRQRLQLERQAAIERKRSERKLKAESLNLVQEEKLEAARRHSVIEWQRKELSSRIMKAEQSCVSSPTPSIIIQDHDRELIDRKPSLEPVPDTDNPAMQVAAETPLSTIKPQRCSAEPIHNSVTDMPSVQPPEISTKQVIQPVSVSQVTPRRMNSPSLPLKNSVSAKRNLRIKKVRFHRYPHLRKMSPSIQSQSGTQHRTTYHPPAKRSRVKRRPRFFQAVVPDHAWMYQLHTSQFHQKVHALGPEYQSSTVHPPPFAAVSTNHPHRPSSQFNDASVAS